MNIHPKAGCNRAAAQRRRRQTAPRSIVDTWGVGAFVQHHMHTGSPRVVQNGNGKGNSINLDNDPNSPRSLIDSGAQSWGQTF